jgi:hypothetical protein
MKLADLPVPSASLKDLSHAQWERLMALLDRSTGIAAAERDPWLAAPEQGGMDGVWLAERADGLLKRQMA